MKKILLTGVALTAALIMTGCGGGGGDDYVPDNATTLFLIDQDGLSYGGVPYICDGMVNWSSTSPNGEFTFYPGENCEFDFIGLEGNYFDDPAIDDIIHIEDISGSGKEGIYYSCESGISDTTLYRGSFYYDFDDRCTFEF